MIESWLKVPGGSTRIVIGNELGGIRAFFPTDSLVVVTDEIVARHHAATLAGLDVLRLPPGEEGKTLSAVEVLYQEFSALKLARDTVVIAFGGGAVSDCAGFAAATYLRGVRFAIWATTLLSQADAALGGKNGVNLGSFKNLVGTIRQPELCVFDVAMLGTLPEEDFRCGFAEIIKHGLIADAELVRELEEHRDAALARDSDTLVRLVAQSARIKKDIVERDEKESGERRLLNFGHTVGHALELALGSPHGQAVALGMVEEARLALRRGVLTAEDLARIERLLEAYGLATKRPSAALSSAVERDKKRVGDDILAPLLRGIGCATVERLPLTDFHGTPPGARGGV